MQIINYKDIEKSSFFDVIEYENIKSVDDIICDVKTGGDEALIRISNDFKDGNFSSPSDFIVASNEIKAAYNSVTDEFVNAVKTAQKNVLDFAQSQLECINNLDLSVQSSHLGHKIIPLARILAYVPGGNYPLPSSCIMTCTPARAAGVKEIMLTSPKIKPETIVAADLSGADKIYKLGGAQAIAAFAYGTKTIKPVDKIVGPGNKFVTCAKKHVYGTVDIDFLAGPSEVLVIADNTAKPELVAADLLAQAEHDKDARAYLITNSKELAQNILSCAMKFLDNLQTKEIASIAFEKSICVIVNDLDTAVDIANKKAPEHLELIVENPDDYIDNLTNYGSLFVGSSCAEVFGDYVSGTNHVLPTNSAAKYTGGLSVFDFIKIATYQNIDRKYAMELSKTASFLAKNEGLMAHKLAADLRGIDNAQ